MLDIYAASETPIEGVSAEALVERIRAFGHRSAHYAGGMDRGIDSVTAAAQPGDAILTLGAGSVYQAGENSESFGGDTVMGRKRNEGAGTLPLHDEETQPVPKPRIRSGTRPAASFPGGALLQRGSWW